MKNKLSVSVILLLLISSGTCAQPKAGKAFKKHSSVFSIGYGFINVWKIFLDKIPFFDVPEYKITATGPVSLIYEYGINQRFSAGLTAGYARITGKAEKYQFNDQITFLSLLARADYHFWTTEKFDPYFGGGVGISNSKYKNLDEHTIIPEEANKNVPSLLDFSGQIGLKYFPAKHVGFYLEAGYVHGAVIHVGISGRL